MGRDRNNPKDWSVVTDAESGTRYVRFPTGVTRAYRQEELAQLCVDALVQAREHPEQADENWLAALRRIVGEAEWQVAVELTGAGAELAEALEVQPQ